MPIYYFDSSALVKLYIPESGSQWVDLAVNSRTVKGVPQNLIATALLGIPETTAAIARRWRLGDITIEERQNLFDAFIKDSKEKFKTITMSEEIILAAAELTQRFSLRGYDAVHLASALYFKRVLVARNAEYLTFVSADKVLLTAATDEGIDTINPNSYE